jgi:hypothetical protein
LPPVAPPSGKFIIQLFLVPLMIVAVAVLILLGVNWLVSGESTPESLLDRLANPNAEIRWRAANEFAQRLLRDDELASNPKVALRLCELTRNAIDALARVDRGLTEAERKKERHNLLEKRKDIQFLCPCLGNLIVPTGVPLLTELARGTKGSDAKTNALLARLAVWSLSNLGQNLKRLEKLTPEQAEAVLAGFREAALSSGETADSAALSVKYLDGTDKNVGVIQTLTQCARSDDPFLRELVALALNFWQGNAADNALAEQVLLTLSRDDGHGVRIDVGETD